MNTDLLVGDLPLQSKRLALQHQADEIAVVGGPQLLVESASRVNGLVGDPDLLDLLQGEEPLAVRERVQGHDAKERLVAGMCVITK